MIEQHWSLAEKFLKKGFWLYLFSFIIAPTGYIIKILISGEISVPELGILYWVISLVTLLSSFNDFWMTESMKFFIPQFLEKKDYSKVKTIIAYAIITQVCTWILISLFLFFWADFLAASYFKSEQASSILKIFCLFFLWINIFQVFNNFFLVIQNTFYSKMTEFLRMLFIMISVVWLIFYNLWTVTNFALAWVIGLYFWILFVLYFFYTKYYKKYLKKEKIVFSKKLTKEIFKYAIVVFAAAEAATLLSQMDMQMIIFFLWATDAWYYSVYLSIITIPFMLIWPIFWLLFPVFSQLHASGDHKKIKLVKQIMQKNFIAVALAFNILFFVFAQVIAYILFWVNYIPSWDILRYSILFLTFNFLLQINFNILAWIWRPKDRLQIILIALIFNFVWNILLIKVMWVYWAALATSLWWILIWFLSEYKLWKKYFSHFSYLFFIKNITFLWLLWIFCYYYVVPMFDWLSRIYSMWIMSLIWVIWFWAFGALNFWEFKKFILEVKRVRW